MKKILAFLLAAMLLLSIVGCAAQTQSDAQPAAAEPAADTSQPTQDSVSAADGDTVITTGDGKGTVIRYTFTA